MGEIEKDDTAATTSNLGSKLVQAMFKSSFLPNTDRKQLRVAAQAMIDAGAEPVDTVWLNLIVARTYRKNNELAIAAYERAYTQAQAQGLGVALLEAGKGLHSKYRTVGRNDDARRVLVEMRDTYGDRVLDGVDRALDKVTDTTGRAITALGRQITQLGKSILGEDERPGAGDTDQPKKD